MGEMARPRSCMYMPQGSTSPGEYTNELWQACAGPLVSVPKIGQRVWYFPQGHMEQVAASTGQPQGADQQMPQYNLPSQILCRVMNLSLSAEADTDEVFAQLALLPEPEGGGLSDDKEEPPAPPTSSVRLFTKILTASDTSTHGGFSVLRKHAEECLPALDMTQETPSQELVATDLHGQEWKFRHTYRGHPRRHLLTTGWSYFVSQKKLVAGDAVVFLRGDNGELRVGIRRTKRQQPSQSSNVLTSHSMHMGVVATASHAVLTRTMFSVYYKPRASPSSFVVPVDKLAKSLLNDMSVGMRFKMRFEGEDASERSYAGTITGIEDLNAACWPNSKWRSLRVNWDEMTNHEQRDRISPWEIELCVHLQAPMNSSPGPKSKRSRPSLAPDLGSSNKAVSLESSLSSTSSKLPGARQGQELLAVGSGAAHVMSEELLKAHQQLWGKRCEEQGSLRAVAESLNMAPPQARWLVAGNLDPHQQRHLLRPDNLQQRPGGGGEDVYSFFPSSFDPTSSAHDHLIVSIASAQMQNTTNASSHSIQGPWRSPPSSNMTSTLLSDAPSAWPLMPLLPPGSTSSSNAMSLFREDQPQQQHNSPLSCSPLSPFSPWESLKQEKAVVDNGCKLFGFSLTELSSRPNLAKVTAVSVEEDHGDAKVEAASQSPLYTRDNESLQQPYVPDKSVSSEPENSDNTCLKVSKEGESRSQSNPPTVRSCTKVIKKGSMVGRGVDLSKFDSYKKLIEELEGMFHLEGELSNPDKGWQVAYSDDEGDMMHVGDDPWTEFCSMVRKIYIFSPEEVNTAGLSQARMQCSRDERPGGRECRDHGDSSVPAVPG